MHKRIAAGHTDSVLCCHVVEAKKLLVSGGEDGQLCFTDLATLSSAGRVGQEHGEAVTSVACCAAREHEVFASAGQSVLTLDLRKALSEDAICDVWSLNQDEINHIAVNRQGSWLAAADDSGEVQVVSLQSRDAAGRPAYKTLRRGHSNICSAVAFRPHRPWEVLSGGLDSSVVRWDFSRLRPQQSWNLNAEAAASGGQVFNPPMVHSVVVPDTEDRVLCRLMAVARGDGCISVYDIDHKPTLAQGSGGGSSSSGGGAAGGGSKKSAKAKRKSGSSKGSSGGGGTAAEAAAAAPADSAAASSSGAGAAASSAAAAAAGAAAAEDPWHVPHIAGRVCLLGREHGGHTAAVNCLAFLAGSDWRRLLSGGNDGRLLLWDWQAAAARQGSAWRSPGEGQSQQQQEEQQQPDSAAAGAGGAAEAVESEPSSSAAAEPATLPQVVLADLKHGRKINWVCSCEPVGGYGVFVADVTQRLTAVALC